MTKSLTWWGVQFTINFLDFITVYVIAHAVLKRSISFTWKHMGMAMLYIVVVAPLFYFDNYAGQIASILGMLLIIKVIDKRKIEDSILILGLSMVMVSIVQIFSLGIAWSAYQVVEFYRPVAFLITQLLTASAILFVYKKFELHQWFYTLQVNVVLKFILLMLALIFLIVSFILNFEYQLAYLLFFIVILVMIGVILLPIMVKLYYNSIGILSVHDLKNSLLSTGIAIRHTNDVNEIYSMFDKHSKQFGMDLSPLSSSKLESNLDQMEWIEKHVELFIKTKENDQKKDVKVISNIRYLQTYNVLDFQLALKWIGTLLDNALEASSCNPIYADLFSTENDFELEVMNEYLGEKGQDINVIFERGYSTKASGRGIGLHNLYTEVTKLGGTIEVETFNSEAHDCQYLKITIKFQEQ